VPQAQLTDDNDEQKEEIYQLRNKLKQEREINNDLEEDLKRKDNEIEDIKKCVENRDDNVKKLDIAMKEREEEIDYLKEKCDSLANQVGKELVLEKKVELQSKVIEELQDKKSGQHNKTEHEKEINELAFEIKQLKKTNEGKVELLENVEKEKEILKEILQNIKRENIEVESSNE
jgi:chromosome segregation ATPase